MTIPQPTSLRSQSPALRALAIGLAVLGLCVFAWGLKYKLSLYDPPHSVSRHIPVAKLLTGNERRALPTLDAPRTDINTGALAFLGAVVLTVLLVRRTRFAPVFSTSSPIAAGRRPVPVFARGATFFIRPPPRFR